MTPLFGQQHVPTEWAFHSGRTYTDPFNEVELDVVLTDPGGVDKVVPAYWAGDQTWRVRLAGDSVGTHRWRTRCSDTTNSDLHDHEGVLEVQPYTGANALFRRGPIQVAADRSHFEHADGTPFLWLGDTWWMGLCKRLRWPEDFRALLADRVAKGFNVVQIVAGLYPDMPKFDPRGANEAGFPWEPDFARVDPAYFDMADLRIQALVDAGIVPCIFGCWGYFAYWMSDAKLRQHWRNLVARWGAYPVVWSLAGEATMLYYLEDDFLSTQPDGPWTQRRRVWTEITKYVRGIDGYHRPLTLHGPGPTLNRPAARDQVEDPSLVDFDMLQTGHGDRASLADTVDLTVAALVREPKMPVINGEVCYEGILEASREEIQRMIFWSSMLSGTAGHTYGANGIWQVNTREAPFGPSPHGASWGDRAWDVAAQLPGSAQLGIGKRLLERLPWNHFESHPEWVEPHWTRDDYTQPYAAGTDAVRLVYFPWTTARQWLSLLRQGASFRLTGLKPGRTYHGVYVDPSTGAEHACPLAEVDSDGGLDCPMPPAMRDWLLLVQAELSEPAGHGQD